MNKGLLFLLLSLLAISNSYGSIRKEKEVSEKIMALADSISDLSKSVVMLETDSLKFQANRKLISCMNLILNEPGSFDYDWSDVESMSKLFSEKGELKIFSWTLIKEDGTHDYFGFIQYMKSKNNIVVYALSNSANDLGKPEKKVLTHLNWYGAAYNDIITVKKGGKKYYTLIGWHGNDKITSRKVIDVLYFTGKGLPKFGYSFFKSDHGSTKRIIFEYTTRAVMSVKYHKKSGAIVFDHLAPSNSQGTPSSSLKGMYEFYGPDGTYDAIKFESGRWRYYKSFDLRNPSKGEPKLKFNQPTNEGPPKK